MDLEKKKRSVTYLFRMSTDPMGSRGDPPPSNRVDVRFLSSDVRGQIMEMKPKTSSVVVKEIIPEQGTGEILPVLAQMWYSRNGKEREAQLIWSSIFEPRLRCVIPLTGSFFECDSR
ncbi:hypothetical protein TNIN_123551 [Trichonephila inaurata madagascariensis]|uniref:Uncharacterized protein n=1 Tax=Trichonephila inaurata madagascariensis TaxID=2747483 RepID=A0A8X7CAW4_9ARAC|nr:hypothetical protein TNIN_123551 [Trichonephila inaurata madagascariensis]